MVSGVLKCQTLSLNSPGTDTGSDSFAGPAAFFWAPPVVVVVVAV